MPADDRGREMDTDDRVLSIAAACRVLGISRHAFVDDPVWPTLVTRPSRGRVGIRYSVLMAELDRRQGTMAEPRKRGRARQTADEMRAHYEGRDDVKPARGYRRRRRAA